MTSISLKSNAGHNDPRLIRLSKRWGLKNDPLAVMALVITSDRLELRKIDEPKLGPVFINFTSSSMSYRRLFGGGRKEALAKAVLGVIPPRFLNVIDATAGLGRDAFILASLGCHVQMLERNPVVAALLDDGLQRAYADPSIGSWLQIRLKLISGYTLLDIDKFTQAPDVVYLDPMYPYHKKTALVKKEIRVLQSVVGADKDADMLLLPALTLATSRVVVKRPGYALPLSNIAPQGYLKTKKHRFDIYTIFKKIHF